MSRGTRDGLWRPSLLLGLVRPVLGGKMPTGRRRQAGVETDDLVTAQCLQEWLEALANQAPQDGAVSLHVADTGRPVYLPGGSGADETDLYSPYRQILTHACHTKGTYAALASVELLAGHRVGRHQLGAQ